jgi:uncharacterized membrane protein
MTAHPVRTDDSGETAKGETMAIGPIQLIVLSFDKPKFKGEILAELDRLKENDVVRLIDGLAVHKDAEGEVTVIKRSDLTGDDAKEFGAVVGALIGVGMAGAEGAAAGAEAGAEATAEGVDLLHEEDALDVVDKIPDDSAAAILLVEHRWAIPLRDALLRANGTPVMEMFIHPLDLVMVGLLAQEEADKHLAVKS